MATAAEDMRRNHEDEEDEQRRLERLQREREEAMEQLLLQQEAEHDHAHVHSQDEHEIVFDEGEPAELINEAAFLGEEQAPFGEEDVPPQVQRGNENENDPFAPLGHQHAHPHDAASQSGHKKITYRQASFLAAAALLLYAFRTRQQYYLAAVYLSSSKWAYVILGNALIAATISMFDFTVSTFLHGLRLQEAEGLQDFFRWNVTETCLALTMFRSELHVYTAVEFLVLILVKCLHQVAILREQHVRMTQDAVVPWVRGGGAANGGDMDDAHTHNDHNHDPHHAPPPRAFAWPMLQAGHVRLFIFLVLLQFLDLYAAHRTIQHLIANGPSVNILFSFEAAILLVSAWSHLLLWYLNVMDSLLQFGHEHTTGSVHGVFRRLLHPWREYKATLVFAVELQAQAVQFLFYLTFFSIVLTYYGMPINLFREVYMSFAALKERLVAFFTYRQLMASMNRFHNATEEELEEAGPTCIICRDEMTVADCKRLPVCRHIFHKSCLREWLVQQQSCPTCRADIATMQVQEQAAAAAAERQQEPMEVAAELLEELQQQLVQIEERERGDLPVRAAAEPPPQMQQERQQQQQTRDTPSLQDETEGSQEKKVRFKVVETDTLTPSTSQQKLFPAVYKVTAAGGAPVRRDDGTIFRMVPVGSLVLCQERMDGLVEQTSIKTPMLRIPDGWVTETDVTHALTIARKTK